MHLRQPSQTLGHPVGFVVFVDFVEFVAFSVGTRMARFLGRAPLPGRRAQDFGLAKLVPGWLPGWVAGCLGGWLAAWLAGLLAGLYLRCLGFEGQRLVFLKV